MSESIYIRLQQDFNRISNLLSDDYYNKTSFNNTITDINKVRNKIINKKKVTEKRLILYCIDTLLEIINENNDTKTKDFADTIHNIPEVCLGKRNIYSFAEEITAFQKKYGKKYFSDFRKVKPKYQKKAPKNKWEFFSPESDEAFKALHPKGYYLLCAVGCIALLSPMWIYIIYVLFINPAPNEWTIMLGGVGTFIIGIGLFNIVAAWIHQYLGHLLTVICILGGGALTALSLFLLYS